jgi:hypothetical protein
VAAISKRCADLGMMAGREVDLAMGLRTRWVLLAPMIALGALFGYESVNKQTFV